MTVANPKSPWRQYQHAERKPQRPGAPVQTPAQRVHCELCFIRDRQFRDAALRIDGRALCLACVRDEELDPEDGEAIHQPPAATPTVLVHDATRERRKPGLLNQIQRAATDAADKVSAPANGAKQESTMATLTCEDCGDGGFATPQAIGAHKRHGHCKKSKGTPDGGAASVSTPKPKQRGRKPKVAAETPAPSNGVVSSAQLVDRLVSAWWGALSAARRAEICARELEGA